MSVVVFTGVMSEDALVRYENLERLCKARAWGATELSAASGRSYSQCRDYLKWRTAKTRKSFGEKMARAFEQALGLPRNWLDEPHDENDPYMKMRVITDPLKGVDPSGGIDLPLKVVTPVLPKAVTWEEVVKDFEQLAEAFWVEVPGDDVAPEARLGDRIEFEKGSDAYPGDIVIVKTPSGSYLMRIYVEIEPGVFRAEAGAGRASLHSVNDGIQVVAYAVNLLKSIRRRER